MSYAVALAVAGLALLFGVATSDNLGQPLAGIITVAAVLAFAGGTYLLAATYRYNRRAEHLPDE